MKRGKNPCINDDGMDICEIYKTLVFASREKVSRTDYLTVLGTLLELLLLIWL